MEGVFVLRGGVGVIVLRGEEEVSHSVEVYV